MIETRCLKNVVIFIQIILIFVMSRKIINIYNDIARKYRARNSILYIKYYINNGENLDKKPIDLSLKNKKIAFCTQLPFEILSFSSHVDNEEINVISSDVEMNESKFLCTKSEKNSFYFKILGISNFLEFHKQLKQEGKIKSDDINEKLSKYRELKKMN